MLKKYGGTTFGFKTDRIADILAPIVVLNKTPMFDYVACYDILYSNEEFKNEINYLCEIIDLYNLKDEQKSIFLMK